MLNTYICIPDEKYSPKHFYTVYFRVCKFWRGEKNRQNTAYAASKVLRAIYSEDILLNSNYLK